MTTREQKFEKAFSNARSGLTAKREALYLALLINHTNGSTAPLNQCVELLTHDELIQFKKLTANSFKDGEFGKLAGKNKQAKAEAKDKAKALFDKVKHKSTFRSDWVSIVKKESTPKKNDAPKTHEDKMACISKYLDKHIKDGVKVSDIIALLEDK